MSQADDDGYADQNRSSEEAADEHARTPSGLIDVPVVEVPGVSRIAEGERLRVHHVLLRQARFSALKKIEIALQVPNLALDRCKGNEAELRIVGAEIWSLSLQRKHNFDLFGQGSPQRSQFLLRSER